ncbi:MAG: FAD-dependent oxidoreductase, partial [Tannerella sp.]|nr:FAD-dependent oxidoreductase [Tannerella sp.]
MLVSCGQDGAEQKEVDICIYGGTASGVVAAYSARMMGKTVLLVEPGKYLGGMTTGGLGQTDIGNKYAVTGLARLFYR